MISILILTRNEEADLLGCLQSVAWSDDIHVFDSMSTDQTVAIAQRFGALVTQKDYGPNTSAFGGDEAAHRNWGLRNIPFKYQWVFSIDADERVTESLRDGMLSAVKSNDASVAYRVQRRDYFMGTWLKHVQVSPLYLRLFRPEKICHERLINTVTVVDGPTGDVSGYLDHFPFSKGMAFWLERHNRYSTFEAHQIMLNRKANVEFSIVRAFAEADVHKRRFHQKELFYRLPVRPAIKFALLYVFKRGFLDGRAGLTYSVLQAIYEYFIVIKTRELMDEKK